jgi:DNA-directed RNA polymerase specialized sigma24 family protein
MPVVKRPVIPTNDQELPSWLCQHEEHVAEYLAVEGQRWIALAKVWVNQIFGRADERLANEIGWHALAILHQHAQSGRLTEIRRFRPWLHGVVKNLTRDAFDQYVRQRSTLEVDPERFLHTPEEPFDAQASATTIHKINDCMKILATGERTIISQLMADPDDPPEPKDIAAALGVSAGSVRVQLSSGRAKLADCLSKKGVLP